MVISAISIIVVALVLVTLVTDNLLITENNGLANEGKWGIYVLDIGKGATELIYSSATPISRIRLSNAGDRLVFSQQINNGNECRLEGSPINVCEEICSICIDGDGFVRLTSNSLGDLVPCWLSDDSQIFFLSFRETMDIFM